VKAGSIQEMFASGIDKIGLGEIKVDAILADVPWGIIRGVGAEHDVLIPTSDIPGIVRGMLTRLKEPGLIGVRLLMTPEQQWYWWKEFEARGMYCGILRMQNTLQQANTSCASRHRPLPTHVGHVWLIARTSYKMHYYPKNQFGTCRLFFRVCFVNLLNVEEG
jgi:hypothetical protein